MKGLFFLISLAFCYFSHSQLAPSTYSNMMSGAQLNHQSALSLFYNPSLSCESRKGEIGIGNTIYYPQSGIYDLQLGVSVRAKRSTLSLGLSQTGFQEFNETTGISHYALQLDSNWSIGITAGITSSNLYLQQQYLPNFSVGISKHLNEQIKLSLGVFAQQSSIYNERLYKEVDKQWNLGFSFQSLNKQFTAYTSAQYLDQLIVALCLYYRIGEQLHFFVSGKSFPVDYSLGARVKLKSLAVLLGFQYNTSLGFSPSTVTEYAF